MNWYIAQDHESGVLVELCTAIYVYIIHIQIYNTQRTLYNLYYIADVPPPKIKRLQIAFKQEIKLTISSSESLFKITKTIFFMKISLRVKILSIIIARHPLTVLGYHSSIKTLSWLHFKIILNIRRSQRYIKESVIILNSV